MTLTGNVVTDRTNLDEQLRDNLKNFAQNNRIYEAITGNASDIKTLDPTETSLSKTTHMRLALENNKRIMSCTVQTFPFVLQAVQAMPGKTIAFIIDEAHSSQSGRAAADMNAVFSDFDPAELPVDEEGHISSEDLLNYLMDSHKMLKTASYFAFTATPKNKTLETFGIKQPDGRFAAFHTYSMKQAIAASRPSISIFWLCQPKTMKPVAGIELDDGRVSGYFDAWAGDGANKGISASISVSLKCRLGIKVLGFTAAGSFNQSRRYSGEVVKWVKFGPIWSEAASVLTASW
ncbi:MAG: type I restriction endonuclease subunit R [Anaerolineae bacterium]|nr:type I restriction endonuclease subunit R [Anaerolineae bacterium]